MDDQDYNDDDRLSSSNRARQDRRDEQDYLERHNPRPFTVMELALLVFVAVLAFDAVRSGISRPSASVPSAAASAVSAVEPDHADDWERYGYDVDLRR